MEFDYKEEVFQRLGYCRLGSMVMDGKHLWLGFVGTEGWTVVPEAFNTSGSSPYTLVSNDWMAHSHWATAALLAVSFFGRRRLMASSATGLATTFESRGRRTSFQV